MLIRHFDLGIGRSHDIRGENGKLYSLGYVYDPLALSWVPAEQAGGGGGGGLTDAQLRASPVPVSGPLTDAELRAVPVPVSGTFWQATQPVSGPLTDAQLRAAAVPVSGPLTDAQLRAVAVPVSGTFWQATQPVSAASLPLPTGASTSAKQDTIIAALPATLGQKAMAASLAVVVASDQSTIPVSMAAASVLFRGRACTFRTPGRAGTAGQNILSLHNATGSPVTVTVTKVFVDMWQTVVKAVTVAPPIVRVWKVTVLPTNGTALTKTKIGGTTTSNAAVTVLGDASADGTGSATTLTTTRPAGTFISQQTAPRLITAAGYEVADRIEFFESGIEVTLAALEGLVVFLDYTLATQNPTTDMWIAGIEWYEK